VSDARTASRLDEVATTAATKLGRYHQPTLRIVTHMNPSRIAHSIKPNQNWTLTERGAAKGKIAATTGTASAGTALMVAAASSDIPADQRRLTQRGFDANTVIASGRFRFDQFSMSLRRRLRKHGADRRGGGRAGAHAHHDDDARGREADGSLKRPVVADSDVGHCATPHRVWCHCRVGRKPSA
jgi:hypothetical protein